MGVYAGPDIVESGLVLALDAANRKSYPGSGTTWTDLSGNGNTGTLSATSIGYDSANGGSLVFDGTDDYVNLSFVNPFAETVIVWAKSATTNWNTYGWLSVSRSQNGHIIHPDSAGRTVDFYMGNSTGVEFSGYLGSVTPDNITIPHMYAYTTNGSNLHKGYLDGVEVVISSSSITRTTSPTAQNYYIGSDFTLNRFGNGNIYSCLRYNRALSATEIAQNYLATRSRYF